MFAFYCGTRFPRPCGGSFVLSGPSKNVSVGESFSVNVLVSSKSQAMNAVSGTLNITGASVNSISKTGSIVDFWTNEPRTIANQVRFEGIVLNPGYQGSSGKLFTLTLSAKKEGTVNLYFSDGALLANDGLGSNIIDSLPSLSLNIKPSGVIVDSIPSGPVAIVTQNQAGIFSGGPDRDHQFLLVPY
jgi:hypothetical protein